MITATVKYNDNYTDIEFPCSEAYLSAKLMEIHVDDLSSTTQYISAITEPNELSFLKNKMINLDEILSLIHISLSHKKFSNIFF